MKRLNEFKKQTYKVYHGTNSDFKKFTLDNSKSSQSAVGWFVDEYSYAASQGKFVKAFELSPNKILDKFSIMNVSDKELFHGIKEFKPKLKNTQIELIQSKIKKKIQDYINGNFPGFEMLNGFGGVKLLKILGFDMEIIDNPYDKKSNFYIVYDDSIIN